MSRERKTKPRESLSQKYLKEILNYDAVSGDFHWKARKPEHFIDGKFHGKESKAKMWNVKFAGEKAGGERLGYIGVSINNRIYMAHRLAWLYVYGCWPKQQLDHINRDGTDNKISNLRDVTRRENNLNVGLDNRNTSGVSGVIFDKSRRKWSAKITINYKVTTLGRFDDMDDAIKARRKAEREMGFYSIL